MKKQTIWLILLLSVLFTLLAAPAFAWLMGGFEVPAAKPQPAPATAPVSSSPATSTSTPRPGATWTEPTTGMEFIWVPGGCYQMGSNDGESDEQPVHRVCVDGFWLGKYEVTQGQWQKIMGNNPANFKKGDNYPVEQVSWEDCQEYARKLSSKAGKDFRLPTEAEWEYAARSGGRGENYAGGSDVDRLAWYSSNSGGSTHAVGGKAANGLGLYDMSGNVWEWCQDWYDSDYYKSSPSQNPTGPSNGSFRVLRGGSWSNWPRLLRSANRSRFRPVNRSYYLGFRLALPVPQDGAGR